MNEQRNEAVWYFVMSVLIACICLKSFDFLGIAGHLLLVIAIGLMGIGFIKLPMIKTKRMLKRIFTHFRLFWAI